MLDRISAQRGMERRGLVLATMAKLKQVCNHPAHLLKDGSRLPGRSGKLERLEEICAEVVEQGEKALVFTQYAEFGDDAAARTWRRSSAGRCCGCTAAPPSSAATSWSGGSRRTPSRRSSCCR